MRFKERQLLQMANCEIMIDMEHYKHELQQIEVSGSDKAKLERLLSAKGSGAFTSVALEALDGWLIIAAHNFVSTSQRGADDRTVHPFRTCSGNSKYSNKPFEVHEGTRCSTGQC